MEDKSMKKRYTGVLAALAAGVLPGGLAAGGVFAVFIQGAAVIVMVLI